MLGLAPSKEAHRSYGQYQDQDNKTKDKEAIPVLGDIPGLGLLFGRKSRSFDKTEIVVMITPRIFDAEREQINKEAQEKIKELFS